MLTKEVNELLTQVGPGTPCGEMMRRYWQPAALAEELPMGGAPVPIRLLGEDLVLFRDDAGQPGLLGLHCSHRGADLSYGRVENGGLRCIYHGWLYDRHGRCLEQPGEPAFRWTDSGGRDSTTSASLDSQAGARGTFASKIQHRAYPCVEAGGLILAYLGPGQPPLVPAYPFLQAPDDRRFNSKIFHECNYLQANEGNYDPIHACFLHWHAENSGAKGYDGLDIRATVEAQETDFGVRVYIVHPGADRYWVRATNFVLPNLSAFPAAAVATDAWDGYTVNWHVPIDDEHHWKYVITFRREAEFNQNAVRAARSELADGYRLIRGSANRYLQDREEMRGVSFAGIGKGFQAHDLCVTEGEGLIQDRTEEHLVYTDKPIVMARLVMLKAIQAVQEGKDPPHVLRAPANPEVPGLVAQQRVLPTSVDWHRFWEVARDGDD